MCQHTLVLQHRYLERDLHHNCVLSPRPLNAYLRMATAQHALQPTPAARLSLSVRLQTEGE